MFSIYAFEELKAQLKDIDELRFIFTSPTFVTEKANKQKREFYILVWIVNAIYMVPSLKSNSAMNYRKGYRQRVCRVDQAKGLFQE